jgi:hypothetical protein
VTHDRSLSAKASHDSSRERIDNRHLAEFRGSAPRRPKLFPIRLARPFPVSLFAASPVAGR